MHQWDFNGLLNSNYPYLYMQFLLITSKLPVVPHKALAEVSHLARWLCTRRFSEPTFLSSGATNHWKNTVYRDFPTFSRTCIFFLLTLSLRWSSLFCSSLLWLFPPLLFHLSILSEVWLLNFLRLTTVDGILHHLRWLKPCKSWDKPSVHELVQDFFHPQYH